MALSSPQGRSRGGHRRLFVRKYYEQAGVGCSGSPARASYPTNSTKWRTVSGRQSDDLVIESRSGVVYPNCKSVVRVSLEYSVPGT
jgi:hypothetical protein